MLLFGKALYEQQTKGWNGKNKHIIELRQDNVSDSQFFSAMVFVGCLVLAAVLLVLKSVHLIQEIPMSPKYPEMNVSQEQEKDFFKIIEDCSDVEVDV